MSDQRYDQMLKELLTETQRSMPFPDFEDEVMNKINEIETSEELVREGYRRGITFSWIFFLIGIVFGVVLTSWIPQFDISFLGVDSANFLLIFQIGFLMFILLHFEKLITMTRARLSNRF
ncbi:hypothetical protein [Rhodohalobacter mucosus]|uniref:Uncharacterized protein n=1 Tax=Rhodohalobacter mucosus TaxID=2079485 RepID=A0A316U394_9BACT|nr:hypothetical protein [Rhodohalobacter mucosus]PWN07866.1 hypothetical protein DDZ15_02325 [Rhodohalobacter mucosus]